MRLLLQGALLLCLYATFGCSGILLHHAIDKGQVLSQEQIQAYRDMNMDVYGCFQIGGPPPAGNTVWIVVPKESVVSIRFGDNCHVIQ